MRRQPRYEVIHRLYLDHSDRSVVTSLVPDTASSLLGFQQLRKISIRENNPDVALRISVESGGCHGYQYKLDLTSLDERQPED